MVSLALQRLLRSPLLVPLVVAVALVVRLLWVAAVPSYPTVIDFAWYFARAIDLVAGRGFSVRGVPTAFWPVGYPAFLALLFALGGPSLLLAKLANVVLGVGAAALSYVVARQLFHSRAVAALTLLMLAFYPNHITYGSLVASEPLFLFLVLLGSAIALCARAETEGRSLWAWLALAALAGIVFGLASLVRAQGPLFAAALLLAQLPGLLRDRARLRRQLLLFATLFAACALVLLPWAARNWAVFGEPVLLSTNGGLVLLAGNGPYATGGETRTPNEYLAELAAGARNEAESDRRWRRAALDYATAHPWRTLSLLPLKLWYTFNSDIEGIKLNEVGLPPLAPRMRAALLAMKALAQLAYLLLLAGSAGTWLKHWRSGATGVALPSEGLWITALIAASCLVSVGGTRYHYPIVPWLAMYVAALIVWWLQGRGASPELRNEPRQSHEYFAQFARLVALFVP